MKKRWLVLTVLLGLLLAVPASAAPQFFRHAITYYAMASSVYATDVDGDADVDVLSAASYQGEITWWENDGSENFTEHTINDNFDGASCVYATDVEPDGDVDVLGAASCADDVTWWENDGSESFTTHVISDTFDGAWSVYATDVDGDTDVDVLGAASAADDITWWENDGSENFTPHAIKNPTTDPPSGFDGADSVYATDVEPDGDVDVLGAAFNADDITWWENDGSENFTEHTIKGNFDGATSVYATDIDGDGDVDVLGAAEYALQITWWENDGSENFAEHTIQNNAWDPTSVYATDVDGDGDVDVLAAEYGGYPGYEGRIKWWENDGSENFTGHTIDYRFDGGESVYATDVDGNGDMDVLGASDTVGISWWQNLAPRTYLPFVPKNYD